jgi:hypothetical protein
MLHGLRAEDTRPRPGPAARPKAPRWRLLLVKEKGNREMRLSVRAALASIGAGALMAGGMVLAAPSHAWGGGGDWPSVCSGGGAGGGGPLSGGGYCDSAPYEDGSHDHCVNVRVLGFGGWQCSRVGP